MPKIRKEEKFPLRLKQLGKVYRLVEQFEEISRIDLSKLSRFAPATITSLTRILIDKKFLIEREVQNTESRGRPAIGLCVSPFYWQSLCAMLVENRFELTLTELNGSKIKRVSYPLSKDDLKQLDRVLVHYLITFMNDSAQSLQHLMTFSIAVRGELDRKTQRLLKLGEYEVNLDLKALFQPHFNAPILVAEYFQTWQFAEATLGNVINCDNVLFIQLDDVINFSVWSKGELLTHKTHMRSRIDNMIVPKFNPLQDLIFPDLPSMQAYQLHNQITHKAIAELIDRFYPNNGFMDNNEKIAFLCERANLRDEIALNIVYHVADSLAYILMNLVQIFSSEKIMLSSSFLGAKNIFLSRVNETLRTHLAPIDYSAYANVEVIVGKYEWNDPIIAAAGVKQGIYDGSLLAHFIDE